MIRSTFLVTGATDGIGRQTALNLVRHGARVLVHGRNQARVEATVADLKRVSGAAELEPVVGDFSSFAQVRSLAEAIRSKTDRLEVLIHNAGVYMKTRVLTADGLETTFQVNHLAPFLLTHLLMDLLEAASAARVVVVSSVAHQGGYVDFQNLQGEKAFDGYSAYALSKLANLLFAFELAERLRGTRITVNGLHPGVISTKLLKVGFNMEGSDVERGARTSTYLATSPEVEGVTGRYYMECKPTASSLYAADPILRRRFWEASEALVKLTSAERLRGLVAQI
jgi:NAD(P)-dependent dehydrogenase (short-subunit alcohol dehydrogenase family)